MVVILCMYFIIELKTKKEKCKDCNILTVNKFVDRMKEFSVTFCVRDLSSKNVIFHGVFQS